MAKRSSKTVKRKAPAPKKGKIKSKINKKSKAKAKIDGKAKGAERRREIVLQILEQIKESQRPSRAAQASKLSGKSKGRKGAAVREISSIGEPHIEKALVARPATPQKRAKPTIDMLGPAVAKERISVKPLSVIKTGIPGFDEMCGGGVEEKSVVLVNGDPGSGKTIFGLQFLYDGAKNGEAALYISFGESREAFYPRMQEFGMDFQDLEDKRMFFVVEYQPHEVAKLIQEEGGTIYDIITSYNIKRVVVDTITPYLLQFKEPYDARLALVRFFNVFRKFGVTTVLLNEWSAHIPMHPSSAVAEFLSDGVVYLIHTRTNEGVQVRGVEIWKMVGVDHTEVARPFAFTKKGIMIYPNERLFVGHSQARQ